MAQTFTPATFGNIDQANKGIQARHSIAGFDRTQGGSRHNANLLMLFLLCIGLGVAIGTIAGSWLLQWSTAALTVPRLLTSLISSATVGALTGLLVAGLFDSIVTGSLDNFE